MASLSRVVALIDMDCFYVACERALDPSLAGLPLAVLQYNPFQGDGSASASGVVSLPARPSSARVVVKDGKLLMPSAANGSIIAVSYEARERGVTRFFRGREALAKCPEIVLVQVPTAHGKSDMGIYRDFGARTLKVISETCGPGALTEKASVDEMYVDVTVPARHRLAQASCYAEVFEAAASASTHVAGAAEAAEQAGMGAQPGGVLARNAFRAGHAGQVVRQIDAESAAWWARPAPEWLDDEALLAAGALIVAAARREVTARLGFTCSAGVAPNKLLAKLCGGLHKPDQQTLLAPRAVQSLLDPLPVDRLRGFGGKLGELLRAGRSELGLAGFESAGALRCAGTAAISRVLRGEWPHPEEKAEEAWRLASGLDNAPVAERPLAKQVGSSKNFGGRRGAARGPLDTLPSLQQWVGELAEDVAARLQHEADENGRTATQLVASLRFEDDAGNKWASARSKRGPLRATSAAAIAREGTLLLLRLADGRPRARMGIALVALTAEGFEATNSQSGALQRMFAAPTSQSARADAPDEGSAEEAGAPGPEEPTEARVAAEARLERTAARPLEAEAAQAARTAEEEAAAAAVAVVEAAEAAEAAQAAQAAEAAEDAQAAQAALSAAAAEAVAVQAQATEQAIEEWSCAACTLINVASTSRCAVCDALRGSSLPAASRLAEQSGQALKKPRLAKDGGRAGAGACRARGRGVGQAGGGGHGQPNLLGFWSAPDIDK